jgi:RNA polymerase sigma-70 factor (ECF subfamily)
MEAQNSGRDDILRLFLQHQVMLQGFLYSLVEDWELVEEALQEAAVFICSRWNEFTPGTNFGAWARSVARMRCREVLQRRRRAQGLPLEGDDIADTITSEDWEEHSEFSPSHKEALTQCLKILPGRHRRVIEMHYLEHQQCDRIASHFKSSVEAIYMSLSRIRKRLKQCVEHRLAKGMV